tara:strand:- start:3495 stop:4154 length:660 start_codon:yes stop_codon:yes gene_type:complete
MNRLNKKINAAKAAIKFIEPGMTVGIGTGSTVNLLIEILPKIRSKIKYLVSSSEASTSLLKKNNLPVSDLNDIGNCDIYIDGADECNYQLQLIKGGGGALTREKILACAAKKFICIIDDSKLVKTLGNFPLPIEILPMAQTLIEQQIIKMNGKPIWREGFITDNGNYILDVHNLKISDPIKIESLINEIPGVITVGIFAKQAADIILIGNSNGVKEISQ